MFCKFWEVLHNLFWMHDLSSVLNDHTGITVKTIPKKNSEYPFKSHSCIHIKILYTNYTYNHLL